MLHHCRIARQVPIPTLSRERASKMHKELARLGISTNRRYELASEITNREVKSLTSLTEAEAKAVWNAVRREWKPYAQVQVTCTDEQALEILGLA